MIFFVFDVGILGFVVFNIFGLVVLVILVEDFVCSFEVYKEVVFIVGVLGIYIIKYYYENVLIYV